MLNLIKYTEKNVLNEDVSDIYSHVHKAIEKAVELTDFKLESMRICVFQKVPYFHL